MCTLNNHSGRWRLLLSTLEFPFSIIHICEGKGYRGGLSQRAQVMHQCFVYIFTSLVITK